MTYEGSTLPPATLLNERLEFLHSMLVSAQPGVLRRIPTKEESATETPANDKTEDSTDESKRNALKLLAIGGLAAVGAGAGIAGGLQLMQPPMEGLSAYPKVQILYDDKTPVIASEYKYTYKDNGQVIFDYPLTNEPNMLLNLESLGSPAPQNPLAGPNGTYIVAYSAICQHLGCIPPYISYYPPGMCGNFNGGKAIIHCVCHGSTYDPGVRETSVGGGAKVITGPTVLPIPQVLLETDSNGFIYATGLIGPAVKGHLTTLIGGQGVGGKILTSSPSTPTQSCPT
ncbi:MAG: Rieske 2Fe-2S domain-containing protein [Candidatus Thermoplasmatota archaeon]|jgi:Rieske Fe-S protein|nr:Rieske 2Fe-2S domain-containing protein [Candidatus Thermoplasmatota archaeon]MCL5984098.1 Rieske 2Fe-2S domain-containing protein [Candidatus Thermoplasmatota archaeon]